MNQSLISCIVPVFNGERYLKETIDSILAQTYRPLEIIVVDDGSTDGTADLVARYGQSVRYRWQSNSGAPTARNHGIHQARGDLIAFLDADDLWHLEKCDHQSARFEARPGLDFCITHLQNFASPELEKELRISSEAPFMKPMLGYVTQTLMARRSLFERIGLFDEALKHGDKMDWFIRAAEHGAVMELMPDVLTYRRLHRNNLSIHSAQESREEHLRLVKAVLDRRRAGGLKT